MADAVTDFAFIIIIVGKCVTGKQGNPRRRTSPYSRDRPTQHPSYHTSTTPDPPCRTLGDLHITTIEQHIGDILVSSPHSVA